MNAPEPKEILINCHYPGRTCLNTQGEIIWFTQEEEDEEIELLPGPWARTLAKQIAALDADRKIVKEGVVGLYFTERNEQPGVLWSPQHGRIIGAVPGGGLLVRAFAFNDGAGSGRRRLRPGVEVSSKVEIISESEFFAPDLWDPIDGRWWVCETAYAFVCQMVRLSPVYPPQPPAGPTPPTPGGRCSRETGAVIAFRKPEGRTPAS